MSDPSPVDWEHPARIHALAIPVEGDLVHGLIYLAQGPGPNPTAVLLHGAAGYEKNLDLAQAVRRGGWNAVFFNYRGYWGSEGRFSLRNSIRDVIQVVAHLTSQARLLRMDPDRMALIGHSLGGWVAWRAGEELEQVSEIAFLAGANLGKMTPQAAGDASQAAPELAQPPIRGDSWQTIVGAAATDPARYDLTRQLRPMLTKRILVVGASRDTVLPLETHHAPLAMALAEAGHPDLTTVVLESDHDFSSVRLRLAQVVLEWLEAEAGS